MQKRMMGSGTRRVVSCRTTVTPPPTSIRLVGQMFPGAWFRAEGRSSRSSSALEIKELTSNPLFPPFASIETEGFGLSCHYFKPEKAWASTNESKPARNGGRCSRDLGA